MDEEIPATRMRNVAIIAHVDHGKTTLVDCLLQQSDTRIGSNEDRVMDSNDLEKERGITILSKNTSFVWTHPSEKDDYRINIVDTPGHADFGGEVERILSMVDGVALVVDASEGPMAQTKFVLTKALSIGLKPFVVVNKCDRDGADRRIGGIVEDEIFDLFVNLDASDEQLDYQTVYASAKEGYSFLDPDARETDKGMSSLFQTLVECTPPPAVDIDQSFKMLVTQIESNAFFGKCLLGRVQSGTVRVNDLLHALDAEGNSFEETRVTKIMRRKGTDQVMVQSAQAGEIVSVAGFQKASVTATLCDPAVTEPIPSTPIDPPTLSMVFSSNDSPLSGNKQHSGGTKMTSAQILDRLKKEAESNVAMQVLLTDKRECFEVRGRGELQLGILIETMRREGFELSITPPVVVTKEEEVEGKKVVMEPQEEVFIDCDPDNTGVIIEKLSLRKGELEDYVTDAETGRAKLRFIVPTRGLIGYRAEFTTDTKGSGIFNYVFHSYVPHKGKITKNQKGALISSEEGECTTYALDNLQSRGKFFVSPKSYVYPGMVIGENTLATDMDINPVKAKHLSNVRSKAADEKSKLFATKDLSLEDTIAYVRNDEIIEVTPYSIRLRKAVLDPRLRHRDYRNSKKKK